MSSIILENGLTSGYEIATAFGISSLYIAGAFKKTKGLLTSLDCYIEEGLDDAQYTTEAIRTHIKNLRENEGGKLPDGLATARSNAYDTGCLEHVKYEIGVSPDDVDKFVNKKLDFVFIDGGHYGEQPMIDFTAVTKHIADKAVIVFHDCFEGSAVHNGCIAAEKYFGIKAIDMKTRWHLTVIPINIDMNFINAFLKTRI
ncbi:hypothetical protein FACS1894186_1270 [Alphaproteobacteria bacterium]|nr:hypothetical protein FACS1894186_1270 [Alphaproteobacteria bacterium]